MKKGTKALLLVLCAILLVGASIAGTVAYLTDTKTVTNTFTMGQVKIKLDEAVLDAETGETLTGRTETGNKNIKLIPGRTIGKDPTVTVLGKSEDCYVRMKVHVENLDNLKEALPDYVTTNDRVFLLQNLCVDKDGNSTWNDTDWEFESFDSSTKTYEFRYTKVVESNNDDTKLSALFTAVTIPGDKITNDNIGALADVQIVVTAEAIQAEGFDTADDAWAVFAPAP